MYHTAIGSLSGQLGLGGHHTRQSSQSTVSSAGPASPFVTSSTTIPAIAELGQSPDATDIFGFDQITASKGIDESHPLPLYDTSALFPTGMSKDQQPTADLEDVPDFVASRRSNSSHGRNTPITPQMSMSEEQEDKAVKLVSEYTRPPVQLFRTESQACQDELFNPANFDSSGSDAASAPAASTQLAAAQPAAASNSKPKKTSPLNNLVDQRLRTANSARDTAASPQRSLSRERSPFRQGAELAPPAYARSPSSLMPTAARQRQKQKDQADQKEFDAHKPVLRRELTKTISPKDALLDAPDQDRSTAASLFSDIIPQGYQRHLGGTKPFPNNFVSGTNQAFGQYVPMASSNMGAFRHGGGVDLNNFLASPLTSGTTGFPSFPASTQKSDSTPEFPAQLTSMESSASDNPIMSSQGSMTSPIMRVRRPADTSAASGTYTCTVAGCIKRFESPAKLQKHKREAHPPEVQVRNSITPSTSNAGTEVTEKSMDDDREGSSSQDDDSVGSGMTSSQLLARNSQTGPHKCTRTNPTTGKPCNTVFSRPYDLTRHEDTIHNRAKQKVYCQYCREEKSFSRNDALTRHMRVVHPEIDFQGKRGR